MEASSVALPSRALQLSEDELTPSKKRERAYAMLRCVCKHLRIECTDGVARLFHLFKYVGRIAMRQYRLAKYHDTYRYYDHWWKWYYASQFCAHFLTIVMLMPPACPVLLGMAAVQLQTSAPPMICTVIMVSVIMRASCVDGSCMM